MPLPRGPRFPTFAGMRPPTSKDRPVLGIGTRVLVTSGGNRSDRVTLTDDSGTSPLGTVAHGVEVEIVAWRPRRGGDTRYRVVTTGDRVEGWLGAASLQPRQPPPAPPKPIITKPIITKPIITKPIMTKPIMTKPIIAKPIIAKPIITAPASARVVSAPRTPVRASASVAVSASAKRTRRGTR
jgi:hypothetical protein